MPPAEDLDTIYRKADQFTSPTYTDPERITAIVGYMSSCLRRILSARTNPFKTPLSILEIGAGLAWMCRAAKQQDRSYRTIAQDVSAEVATKCGWVDRYLVCDIFDAQLDLLASFDVISLTHVIEHLPDPVGATHRCKSLLAKGGTILMTAPFRPKGWEMGKGTISEWQQYSYNHVPAHIQYFSKESMQKLAEKAGCKLCYWDDSADDSQAFEAWLS